VREQHADVEALLAGHFHGQVGAHHVAGMVQHHQQHAGRAVGLFEGLEDLRRGGGGEDVAHHADVEHALAHEPAQRRLMPRAAEGHQGHLVLRLRPSADHQFA
jgi:hypothetical protein